MTERTEAPLPIHIDNPEQLKELPVDQLEGVCQELRNTIIDTLSRNPGHFASSMGAVELTVALHYVYDTPKDRIVWDVGHQAYAHKLLTGRRNRFHTLRQAGGLSGFPSPRESRYDTFTAGHASNSISAALGMAVANSLRSGNDKSRTVAVIGDASIAGGLAFEGLNNAANTNADILIILNDNEMSIDEGTGALHRYLSKLSTSARYNKARFRTANFLRHHHLLSEKGRGQVIRFANSLKSLISKRQNIFEGLNIRYFGPIDGHDVKNLVKVLNEIKDMKGPRLLHICTTKGKGYEKAELDPTTWHAPGKFDPVTGERPRQHEPRPPKWQDVFGQTLVELAHTHPEVVVVTAAMPSGTSVSKMLQEFPERTFDVGICEGHAVTFAGGLASAGLHPFVAIYSSFLQRAYDNIIHDVAIQGLGVTFCIDRAGLVGEDGVTHHGLFDLAYLSVIPGMNIASPMDETTLRNLMYTSLFRSEPFAIRYPRGEAFNMDWKTPMAEMEWGRGRVIHDADSDIAVLTLGPIGHEMEEVIRHLNKEGLDVAHYDMIWLKPLDQMLLHQIAQKHKYLITIEDASVKGGLGSAVADWLKVCGYPNSLEKLGVDSETWIHHDSVENQRKYCGFDTQSIFKIIKNRSMTLQTV